MTGAFSFDMLSGGSLVLTVGEGCIHTAAKRAHRELTTVPPEGGSSTVTPCDIGSLTDTLERFLTTTDFSTLRAEHPELAGGTRCLVRLLRCENGRVAELGIETLVCGAITDPLQHELSMRGVEVIGFVAGEIDGVVRSLLDRTLPNRALFMPGCCGRQNRFRGGRGRGGFGGGGFGRKGRP